MLNNIISFGKVFSDQTRLKIIKLLLTKPLCVCELMQILKSNQSRISQHLAILKYHGLLKATREGKWIIYEVNRKVLDGYIKKIGHFIKSPLYGLPELKRINLDVSKLKKREFLCRK